jgi:hypothetical protein
MDTNSDFDSALPHTICGRLERKFALARCWYEPFPGRIYIRYASGYSEYLTMTEAQKLLG